MTAAVRKSSDPACATARQRPVEVRLQRVNSHFSKIHPAPGDNRQWWERLLSGMAPQMLCEGAGDQTMTTKTQLKAGGIRRNQNENMRRELLTTSRKEDRLELLVVRAGLRAGRVRGRFNR